MSDLGSGKLGSGTLGDPLDSALPELPPQRLARIPKLKVPLQMGRTGFEVIEQDSEQEVAQCVYALIATPRGARLEDVDYGVDDPSFENLPIDDTEWLEAISKYEPRASVTTVQQVQELVDDVIVVVGVQ